MARDLCRHAEPDAAPPHLGERHRPAPAIGLVGEMLLPRANLLDGPREIAVPFERVHGQVEMGVEDQHAGALLAIGRW